MALGKTLGELGAMSLDEYEVWLGWREAHGVMGPERLDWLAAMQANTVARCNGAKTQLADFLLFRKRPEMDWQQMQGMVKAMAEADAADAKGAA